MDIVKVIQSVTFEQPEQLQNGLLLFFVLEIQHKTGVVFISVFEGNSIAILVSHLVHTQPVKTYHLGRIPPGISVLSNDEDISNQHRIYIFQLARKKHFGLECP